MLTHTLFMFEEQKIYCHTSETKPQSLLNNNKDTPYISIDISIFNIVCSILHFVVLVPVL